MNADEKIFWVAIIIMVSAGFVVFHDTLMQNETPDYDAKVEYIYSSNTFYASFNNWHPLVGENIPIIIKGIEDNQTQEAIIFLAESFAGKAIELYNVERDINNFALRADVFVDNKNIAEEMIKLGLVKRILYVKE